MPWLLLAAALCTAVHLGAIALAAMQFGIPIREIHYGWGPTLLRLGPLRIKPLVFAGSVVLKDGSAEGLEGDAKRDAFDSQPRMTRLLIGCAGPFALLVSPFDGLGQVGSGFVQYVEGALSPFGQAQRLLRLAAEAAGGLDFVPLLGLVAAKTAAFNLLPLPGSNGGFLLQALFERTELARRWPPQATQAALLLFLGSMLSWLLALAAFLWPLPR